MPNFFLFRPVCDFSKPFDSCSNGWLMYYVLAVLVVIAFKNPIVSAADLVLLVLIFKAWSFGIPAFEITIHWILGSFIGFLVARKFQHRAPPFVERGILHNFTGFLQITMVLVLAALLYFGIDETVHENDRPYGLAATFVMIATWLFAASFFLYCVLNIEKNSQRQQMDYWKLWLHLTFVVFVVMFSGFVPDVNSFLKAAIATPILAVGIILSG